MTPPISGPINGARILTFPMIEIILTAPLSSNFFMNNRIPHSDKCHPAALQPAPKHELIDAHTAGNNNCKIRKDRLPSKIIRRLP